jgi:hypothetical protein
MTIQIPDVWGQIHLARPVPIFVLQPKGEDVSKIPEMFTSRQDALDYLRGMQIRWTSEGVAVQPKDLYEVVRVR